MKTDFTRIYLILLILSLLGGCTRCTRSPEDSQIPKFLDGMILTGKIENASGIFSGLEGYTFTTTFESNRTFTTKDQNSTESRGDYSYTRLTSNTARLTLTDRSTNHSGEQVEVVLTFDSPSKGSFIASLSSESPGEHKGIFELALQK